MGKAKRLRSGRQHISMCVLYKDVLGIMVMWQMDIGRRADITHHASSEDFTHLAILKACEIHSSTCTSSL